MNTSELLQQLRQPFPPDAISWLPGATTKDGSKCMAMAYADLRAYQERLDELMDMDWSVRYTFWGDDRIACELTLYVGDALGRREGITRSSTGEMSAQDEKNGMGGTVAEAQAFKRAAAMFGLGRYLYELPAAWVGFDSATKKISKEGQADLDNRYRTWYQKTMAATKRSAPVDRIVNQDTGEIVDNPVDGDVLFAKSEPATDKEHDTMSQWSNYQDARSWAVMVGACINEHEAKNSMKKVVMESGLEVNDENKPAILLAFLRRQNEKLAAPVPA